MSTIVCLPRTVLREAWEYAVEETFSDHEAEWLYEAILGAMDDEGRDDEGRLSEMLEGGRSVSIRRFAEERGLADRYR